MTRRVWVIQKPRFERNVDRGALDALGQVGFLLPAAPNAFNLDQQKDDIDRMAGIIREAGPDDLFVAIGGSPLSHILFTAAAIKAGRSDINFGLYSRGRDADGRRGGAKGTYRAVPVPLGAG